MTAASRLLGLAELIREWRDRLGDLRRAMIDHSNRERWLSQIRARVLSFLISRYDEYGHTEEGPAAPRRVERPRREAFCAVEPREYPPKSRRDLRPLLLDIRQQKELSRPRWRFWP